MDVVINDSLLGINTSISNLLCDLVGNDTIFCIDLSSPSNKGKCNFQIFPFLKKKISPFYLQLFGRKTSGQELCENRH